MGANRAVTRRETGDRAEALARQFLEARGYRVVTTNYHCRYGEADIIAEDAETLVFVEVRSKRGTAYGSAAESITETKQRKLRLTVETYLSQLEKLPADWRIDAVLVSGSGASLNIEQIKDAVGG
jgi:putative endonuclease